MKTQFLFTVLLILFACGIPTPEQQSQSQVVEPSAVTTASEFAGKVIKVVDSDTIDVLTDDKEPIRIRLHGIDCPERGQPFGNTATQVLNIFILGNVVKVVPHGQDRCERTIGVSAGNRNRSVVLKPAK